MLYGPSRRARDGVRLSEVGLVEHFGGVSLVLGCEVEVEDDVCHLMGVNKRSGFYLVGETE
jgi:hypothetical protein